jgi:hypothetical protein
VFTELIEVTSAFTDADTPATAMATVELRPIGALSAYSPMQPSRKSSIIVNAPAFRIGRFVFAPRANAFDSRPRTHCAPAVNTAHP